MTRKLLAAVVLMAVSATVASAQASGTPCTAPVDIYTGSGIPTANSLCGGANGVNLYLGVSQRYTSPIPTTDGNGNWTAETGNSTGAPTPPGNVGFAKWNFNFATANAGGYLFRLTVTGLDISPLTWMDWTGNFGDSSNLGYAGGLFDNTDVTTYTFRLDQFASTDVNRTTSLAHLTEVVNTTSTVPEPSTYVLMASGLLALGMIARRRRNVTSSTIA